MEALASSPISSPLPILELDLGAFASGHPTSVSSFLQCLRVQCSSVGLFYVSNHGVPQHLCDSLLRAGRQFFDLPLDVKMQIDYRNSPQFRGYMKLGCENTNGLTDYREQIDLGPQEEEDVDLCGQRSNKLVYPLYRRLRGPNQWPSPELIPDFRPLVEEYTNRMSEVSMMMLQAISLSLGLHRDYFESLFSLSPHYQMKVVKYPMKSDEDVQNEKFGVGPHTDSGFLTLLLQDDIGGLQAKTLDGEWRDVPPKLGTFVVNLGEMMQLATGGHYVATVHQVLNRPCKVPRYSVPFFFNPRLDAHVRPMELSAAVWEDRKSLGMTLGHKLVENGVIGASSTHGGKNKMLPVYGLNAFKSFSRSHPEALIRHHPDCLGDDESIILKE